MIYIYIYKNVGEFTIVEISNFNKQLISSLQWPQSLRNQRSFYPQHNGSMTYKTAGKPAYRYLNILMDDQGLTNNDLRHGFPILPWSSLCIQKSLMLVLDLWLQRRHEKAFLHNLQNLICDKFNVTNMSRWSGLYLLPVSWAVTVIWAKVNLTIYFPQMIHDGYFSEVIKRKQCHCPPVEIRMLDFDLHMYFEKKKVNTAV